MKDPTTGKVSVLQGSGGEGTGKIGLFDSGFGSVSLARSGVFASQETNLLPLAAGPASGLVGAP